MSKQFQLEQLKSAFSIVGMTQQEVHNSGIKLSLNNKLIGYLKDFKLFFLFDSNLHYEHSVEKTPKMKMLLTKVEPKEYRINDKLEMYAFTGDDIYSGDLIYFISQLVKLDLKKVA